MGTTTSYVPYDYRRTCDLCGNLYNISKMFKKGPYTYCLDHVGERISEQLDRGNAAQRPFRVLPVPNAKPEDQTQPDMFESEESVIFALLGAGVAAGARYLNVISGTPTALPNAADVIPTNAWACIHYYGLALATYPKGHVDVWHAQALARMRTSADILLALQTGTGTVATNSFYGGFLGTGAATYYSEDASTAGLAMIFAYRLLGDLKYLYAARAAASFLRNLQAIGSCGVHFTSSDAAGLARLDTGGIVNSVATGAGFYSDHAFYPSSLLALRFWNELKLTDGDQAIGATTAVAGDFTTVPSKLMTACMSLLYSFWQTGTYDVTKQDTRTGLSPTTPAEFFNAYPLVKPNASLAGSGSWEYQDGPAISGTLVTSLNFAKALGSLYEVHGLTGQVKAIDDWLQAFTSNPAFETAANTSARDLARATTGTYVPSQAIAQQLLVRDPTTLAPVAKNGGSLYDWGAFGILSSLWASRHGYGFKLGRNASCQRRRRLSDGLPSDEFWDDRGFLRGRQGLTWQTGFSEVLGHGPSTTSVPAAVVTSPPTNDMVFWFKSDAGVSVDGSNRVTLWADQGPHGYDVASVNTQGNPSANTFWPVFTPNVLNGLPALSFLATQYLQKNFAPAINLPLPDNAPLTCIALLKPTAADLGVVCTMRTLNSDLEMGIRRSFGSEYMLSSDQDHAGLVVQSVQINRTNQTLILDWEYYGAPNAAMHINGVSQPLTNVNGNEPLVGYNGTSGFAIGYIPAVSGGYMNSLLVEIMVYGGTAPATLASAYAYLQQRAGLYQTAMIYDAVAAAQFAVALRQSPRA